MAAYGLPWRLEVGFRYYPVNFFEASLRHQLNPRDFTILDCSLDFQFAHLFGGYSYLRYGISLSKNFNEIEPYVHYSAYHFVNASSTIFDDSFIRGAAEYFINNNRSIGFGIALPAQKRAKLYPEVNYQYFGNDIKHGLWHVGVGFRVFVNQGDEHE